MALLNMLSNSFATHRLAGFTAAEFQNMAASRLQPEIMIKADNAMHFCARQVERIRDGADGILADKAKFRLHIMQDRK